MREPRLLAAFEDVPRHLFVPADSSALAHEDGPLAIGFGQTISQPYIVALMTSLLHLHGEEIVLEVGTGSGYQAAILSRLAGEVHTVEIIPQLAASASKVLKGLGFGNVHVHQGDGSLGWKAAAPYAAIMVTAAAPGVPAPLIGQLADGASLVTPIDEGAGYQVLRRVTYSGGRLEHKDITGVSFVPLRGRHGIRRGR